MTGAMTGPMTGTGAGGVPLPLAGQVRAELDRFVAAIGPRRTLVPRLYVGAPGGERIRIPDEAGTGPREAGWRADLVERGVSGVDRPVCGWITRSGDLAPSDHDIAWCGATRDAFARHGLALPGFFVLNRHGWADILSGDRVHYHRIRRR